MTWSKNNISDLDVREKRKAIINNVIGSSLIWTFHSDAVSRWAGWALAHPEFGVSVNPIPTGGGGDYAHHITACQIRKPNDISVSIFEYRIFVVVFYRQAHWTKSKQIIKILNSIHPNWWAVKGIQPENIKNSWNLSEKRMQLKYFL